MTSIRFRIVTLILALALGEAAILGVISYSSINAAAQASAAFPQIASSLEKTRSLNVVRASASIQLRTFALKRDSASLEAFRGEWKKLEEGIRACGTSECHGIAKQPLQMLRDIQPSVDAVAAEQGKIDSAMPTKALTKSVNKVEKELDEISHVTGHMAEKIIRRARQLEDEAEQVRHRALFLTIMTTVVTALAAILLCYPLVSSITNPLYSLMADVDRFASGNWAHRVLETGGRETMLLAQSFNQMADKVVSYQSWLEEEIRRKDGHLSRSERLATIGLLASSVAHQLNNPLTGVLMNAKLSQEQLREDNELRQLIEEIVEDAERCRAIVAELRLMGQHRPVAATDASLFISGESGTGKEVLARFIHSQSARRDHPMVAVNCPAFSETLMDSEVFGHTKGAFTGAVVERRGCLELAFNGVGE